MYYDLNIPWPAQALDHSKKRNLSNEYVNATKSLNAYLSSAGGASGASEQAAPGETPLRQSKKQKKQQKQNAVLADQSSGTQAGAEAGPSDLTKQAKAPTLSEFDPTHGLSTKEKEHMQNMTLDLVNLGYRFVAYNHIIQSRFESNVHQNPFYDVRTKEVTPPFPGLDPRTKFYERKRRKLLAGKGKAPDTIPYVEAKDGEEITQYSRCTIVLDEESAGKGGHGITSAASNALLTYDLLAVCPTSEAAFALACLTLTDLKPNSVDIISFDLAAAPRMPFQLKRSAIGAALANGVVFEICYGAMVGTQDVYAAHRGRSSVMNRQAISSARKNLISCAKELLRVTNGKGVIFSSGAAEILGLRGPSDVINLAAILGMNQAAAKEAISSTCRSLMKRAETRKTWRGIVGPPQLKLIKPPGLPKPPKAKQVAHALPDPVADMSPAKAGTKRRRDDDSEDGDAPADGQPEKVNVGTPASKQQDAAPAKSPSKAKSPAKKKARS